MPDALDLFGGAGGAAMGLHLLGLTEHGIEWGTDECATRTAAGFDVTCGDVADHDPADFKGIEGLWMSPPCPDWSVAGRGAGRDGSSGWLVDQVPRWAEVMRPKWIACENVPPVLPVWQEFTPTLQRLGYHTWAGCLSAEEYGVPQTRDRAYLVAHLDHPVGPPPATHQPYVYGQSATASATIFGDVLRPWVSMAEALGWGPGTEINTRGQRRTPGGNEFTADGPSWALTEKARSWRVNTGRDWKKGGDRSEAQTRPASDPAPTVSANSTEPWRWELVPGAWADGRGGNRRTYRPDEPAPTIHFGHDAAAWVWRRPATTIQGDARVFSPGGHMANDGRNNAEMVGRSEDAIRIEPWEALVLQSMPANYPLVGTRTSQFRQVGNLVPPFMVTAIVGEMLGLDWLSAIDAVTGGR